MVLWGPIRPFRTNTKKKKDVLFIIGKLNEKVGSQEISEVKGKFGLGVQNCSLLALNPGHNLGSYGGFKEKKN